jgi:hypothetical protein
MKKWLLACFALQTLTAASVYAAATTPNQLLGGLTTYKLNDYENLYDSNGNVVTGRLAQAGDSLQGVFVITSVQNALGTASYGPAANVPGSVELTGVFDELVSSVTTVGSNVYTNLVPDNTTAVGSGSQAKFMSGAAFQASYGTGSMIAVFANNTLAMPVGSNGNGLAGIGSTVNANLLATSGTKWATFGAAGANGAPGVFGGNYYWQGLQSTQTGFGVASFAASVGFIQNLTGIPSADFQPITQSPPVGSPNPGFALIPNIFIIQGTTNPTDANLAGTPYTVFSTDPAKIDFIPEPTGIVVMGGLFGLWALGLAAFRRFRKA